MRDRVALDNIKSLYSFSVGRRDTEGCVPSGRGIGSAALGHACRTNAWRKLPIYRPPRTASLPTRHAPSNIRVMVSFPVRML
jgi:hypothetical protein